MVLLVCRSLLLCALTITMWQYKDIGFTEYNLGNIYTRTPLTQP